jgi:hypothetical protein
MGVRPNGFRMLPVGRSVADVNNAAPPRGDLNRAVRRPMTTMPENERTTAMGLGVLR